MDKGNVILLKEETESLCNICYKEIKASVYAINGKVFLEKKCPIHGSFKSTIETDIDCYKRLAHLKHRSFEDKNFCALIIPITYKCNLNCEFCFLPHRDKKDLNLEQIKKIISDFKGPHIGLSGGEPTLCAYLPEIIQHVRAKNKKSILVTNGLRLADIGYVKALKRVGLDCVELSLDGLDSGVYKSLKHPERVLRDKMAAVRNLEKENIPITLSITIYKGTNEAELKKIFYFAAKSDAVFRLKIRTSVKIGKFNQSIESYSMSELLKMFSHAVNIAPKDLLSNYLSPSSYFYPYGASLKIYYLIKKGRIVFMPLLTRLVIGFHHLLFILILRFGSKKILSAAYKIRRRKMRFVKCLHLRIICWPTVETIDLGELKAGIAHVYDKEVLGFCHAVILNRKL